MLFVFFCGICDVGIGGCARTMKNRARQGAAELAGALCPSLTARVSPRAAPMTRSTRTASNGRVGALTPTKLPLWHAISPRSQLGTLNAPDVGCSRPRSRPHTRWLRPSYSLAVRESHSPATAVRIPQSGLPTFQPAARDANLSVTLRARLVFLLTNNFLDEKINKQFRFWFGGYL